MKGQIEKRDEKIAFNRLASKSLASRGYRIDMLPLIGINVAILSKKRTNLDEFLDGIGTKIRMIELGNE